MKEYLIRFFMVTYKSPSSVANNLRTLFNSKMPYKNVRLEINIINNHPSFQAPSEYEGRFNLLQNWHTRSENSCGHLSRDYNTALIKGFENLNDPKCSQVITCHDDINWNEDWLEKLLDIHHTKGFSLYMGNWGDSVTSYLPDAVKKIGLWDERFCNIGFHEADYQIRARIYNGDHSTINDIVHGRVWNPTEVIFDRPETVEDRHASHIASTKYHSMSRKIFAEKWNVHSERWDENGIWNNPPSKSLIPNFIYYPYFEKDIENLKEKGYIFSFNHSRYWYDDWIYNYSKTTNDPLSPLLKTDMTSHTWGRAKLQNMDLSPRWDWSGASFNLTYGSRYVQN